MQGGIREGITAIPCIWVRGCVSYSFNFNVEITVFERILEEQDGKWPMTIGYNFQLSRGGQLP